MRLFCEVFMPFNSLVAHWENLARRKFLDAEQETDPMGKKLIEHGAVCYFNCARQLRQALHSGDMPFNFNLEILHKNTECP